MAAVRREGAMNRKEQRRVAGMLYIYQIVFLLLLLTH